MQNRFGILSPHGEDVEGPWQRFADALGLPPDANVIDAAEGFARLIRDFLDRPHSRFVLGHQLRGGYVQLLIEPDGTVYAEVASNSHVEGSACLAPKDEFDLLADGWMMPGQTPCSCVKKTDNFWRRWSTSGSAGELALTVLTTLSRYYGVECLGDLDIRYFILDLSDEDDDSPVIVVLPEDEEPLDTDDSDKRS